MTLIFQSRDNYEQVSINLYLGHAMKRSIPMYTGNFFSNALSSRQHSIQQKSNNAQLFCERKVTHIMQPSYRIQ